MVEAAGGCSTRKALVRVFRQPCKTSREWQQVQVGGVGLRHPRGRRLRSRTQTMVAQAWKSAKNAAGWWASEYVFACTLCFLACMPL